ncbi:MAG TPA: hypothetical protein VEG33_13300 [Streptosporangiaceae bacterium]|nr:hypothetical protein [Streptosporangiaceae bacterium]
MASCLHGHPVSPGSEFCETCGDDVRPRCGQGHRSGAGAQFCETCGELLAAPQAHPGGEDAGVPVLDYRSGSFTDFILDDQAGLAGPGPPPPELDGPEPEEPAAVVVPSLPEPGGPEPEGRAVVVPPADDAAPVTAGDVDDGDAPSTRPMELSSSLGAPRGVTSTRPMDLPLSAFSPARGPAGPGPAQAAEALPEPWRNAQADVLASLPPYGERGGPPSAAARPGRRRARTLSLTLALAVLAVGGTAGALTLLGHHASAPQASPPPQPGGAPGSASPTGSAGPTGRPRPALPVRASGWTAPVPIDQTALNATNAVITGLSCPRVSVCYAVDSAGNILSSTSRSAGARGAWQVVANDQGNALVAISCATAGFCLAVDKAGDAITLRNGSWGSPVFVDARTGTFTSVSCPDTTFCMAADSGGNAFAYIAASNTWQPFTVDSSGGLTGVSCTSPDHCVAVDTGGGAYTYDGSSWSTAVPVDVGHAFTAVSCASPSFCAAADDGGNGAILAGGSWRVAAMGMTAGALACPVDGFCLAANASGGTVAYHYGAWSAVTRIDGQRVISALSCPALTACTAADRQDNVLYYAPPRSG